MKKILKFADKKYEIDINTKEGEKLLLLLNTYMDKNNIQIISVLITISEMSGVIKLIN